MGIQGLTKLLNENAPDSVKDQKLESYFGRRIAVDASMQIYSFMVVVGRTGDQMLTDADGNVTSHLQGMFFRTTRMMEAGLKPIFVFDGKPPEMKSDELSKRTERKAEAEKELLLAKERGDQEAVEKLSKRTVRVTREQTSECQRLLRLMGVPVVEAPSEAEAQCASLCKRGLAYAVATEDMDALTFGAPRLVRNLMAPASANKPVMEFDLPEVLKGLGLSQEEFVDLCILCGCDYTEKIGGIGPTRALALVKKYKRIENILDSIDATKYKIPAFFPYQQARKLFLDPEVLPEDSDEQAQDGGQAKAEPTKREETEEDHKASTTVQQEQTKEEGIEGAKEEEKGNEANAQEEKDNGANAQEEEKGSEAAKMELNAPPSSTAPAPLQFKWPGPDEEGLVQFLVHEKGFNEDRVRSAAHRIVAAKSKSSQGRLDAFFAPLAGKAKPKAPAGGGAKRKAGAGGGGKFVPKRGKMGAFGKKK